jgi:lysophospholipase L1-like esterase
MKNFLFSTLFFLIFSTGFAQTYNPANFTVSNKSYGVAQDVSTDARSLFYDATLFKMRPYQSTAEVLSYLNLAKYRSGYFPIWVNVGGTLSGSTFTGGSLTEYWFRNGTSNSDLVIKSPGTSGTDTTNLHYQDSVNAAAIVAAISKHFADSTTLAGRVNTEASARIAADANKADKTATVTFNGNIQTLGNNPSFTVALGVTDTSNLHFQDSLHAANIANNRAKQIADSSTVSAAVNTEANTRATADGGKVDKTTTVNGQALSSNVTIPTVSSYSKNATRDSIILVLSDGTRIAVKDSVGSGSSGTSLANIYTKDSTLNSNRTVTMGNYTMSFVGNKTIVDSLQVGATPTTVGILYNESFPGTSIPATMSKGSQLTASFNNKATLTGAPFWFAPAFSANTTPCGSALQYNTKRMPYEKVVVEITVVPKTKAAGNVLAVTHGSAGNPGGIITSSRETFAWDFSNSYTSGRFKVGFDSITNFAASVTDSTSRAVWTPGDTTICYYIKDGLGVTGGIRNKTTGIATRASFSGSSNGSGGLYNFVALSGSQATPTFDIINIKVTCFERKNAMLFIGDSQTGSNAATQQSRRFADLIYQGNSKFYNVVGLPSAIGKNTVANGIFDEVLSDMQPRGVISGFGYNDESDPTSAPVFSTTIDSIRLKVARAAKPLYLLGIVPRQSATDIYNDTVAANAARNNVTFIDIRTPLMNGASTLYGGYNGDGTHINNAGNVVVANAIIAKMGSDLYSPIAADTVNLLSTYNIPSANNPETVRLKGLDRVGREVLVPNFQSVYGTGINNLFTTSTSIPKTIAQTNSLIDVDNEIRTRSYFQSNGNGVGGQWTFHNDLATVTETNLEITNAGIPGTGIGKYFRPWTTDGYNISVGAHLKNTTFGTLTSSAKNNIGLGFGNLEALTSGNNNIDIATGGSSTITTGTNNYIFSNNHVGPTTSSNQILIGDAGGATWGDAANRIFIGKRNGSISESIASGDIVLEAGNNISSTFYVGAKTNQFNVAAGYFIKPPTTGGTGGQIQLGIGSDLKIDGGQSFSTIYKGGTVGFRTALPATNTTFADRFTVSNDVATASGGLQMSGTSKGFIPTTVTTTQRDNMRVLQSIAIGAGGTGVTDGAALVFTGSCTITPVGYVRCTAGTITSIVISYEGAGVASGLTVAVGSGSGVTLTPTVGIPDNTTVICSDCTATDGSVGPMQVYKAALTTWKNAW